MVRKVTVRDVAAAANVSTATASRVLAKNPKVDPAMAQRVLKASNDLGYSANVFARALRTQRTDTIGMVVPSISNSYFVTAVEAVEKVLAESGRALLLCDARDSVTTESDRLDVLVQRMVDGLIIIPVATDESAPAIEAAAEQAPVVMLDRFAAAKGTDFVGADDADGIRQCMDHLRQLACKSVVYVGAQPRSSTALDRLTAFQNLVGETADPQGATLLGEFSSQWGEQAALQLLARDELPDAIVCGADIIAVSLFSTLRNSGIDVPGRVKIMSFDGSFLSQLSVPRLTSVRQPIEAMAQEAVRLLDARSGKPDQPMRKSIFDSSLIVAGSTDENFDRLV